MLTEEMTRQIARELEGLDDSDKLSAVRCGAQTMRQVRQEIAVFMASPKGNTFDPLRPSGLWARVSKYDGKMQRVCIPAVRINEIHAPSKLRLIDSMQSYVVEQFDGTTPMLRFTADENYVLRTFGHVNQGEGA